LLVPLDGSALSEQALPAAKRFAELAGQADVELLYVLDPSTLSEVGPGIAVAPGYLDRALEWAKDYLALQAATVAGKHCAVTSVVEVGSAAREILERAASQRFDYICMATHGRSGLARAFIGSVTDRVIRESPIPVLAVCVHPSAAETSAWPGHDAPARSLIELFKREDVLSLEAVDALIDRGSEVVPDLIDALASGSTIVRRYAARTLGQLHDPRSLGLLVDHLSHDTFEVRWEAAEAIVKYREAGISAVLRLIAHEPLDERRNLVLLHVLDRAPTELIPMLRPVIRSLRAAEHHYTAPIAASKALAKMQEAAALTR